LKIMVQAQESIDENMTLDDLARKLGGLALPSHS